MPKYTVQITRRVIEARLVEVVAADETRARRIALQMARHVDKGGTVKQGYVGEFCDGTPQARMRVQAVWPGWQAEPFNPVDVAILGGDPSLTASG
jgi:hypothetical protein